MSDNTQTGQARLGLSGLKVGLGLSGGGFRASIFHLGVIRRLEELGIMPFVDVISSVSGGSIIAAYYVIEMERRLGARRDEINGPGPLIEIRAELFHEIAGDFFAALDHNLRTRALVFAPFYHPLACLRMATSGFQRASLIQAEYDHWFYRRNTLDQLPSALREGTDPAALSSTGPKLVLNTTSLLTGDRVAFSREPLSGITELGQINRNVLPLSQIVGASAGVPGLFPPTSVAGDWLVDGGVSDNQGLEGLWSENCDVVLVSDASGQMEEIHRMGGGKLSVLSRTNTIFQFQIRRKLTKALVEWKEFSGSEREFAFVHLFQNLKDRHTVKHLVASEFIPGLGRIRTDLDQFSFVEREALMYHGYTLIDAQIKQYCPRLVSAIRAEIPDNPCLNELSVPPLFAQSPARPEAEALLAKSEEIKNILEAGSESLFIVRAIRNYGWAALLVFLLTWAVPIVAFFAFVFPSINSFADKVVEALLGKWLLAALPAWLSPVRNLLAEYLQWPLTLQGATVAFVFVLLGYVLLFFTYSTMRRVVSRWDLSRYRKLANGHSPEDPWESASGVAAVRNAGQAPRIFASETERHSKP